MTEEKLGILSQRILEFEKAFEDDEACILEIFRRYDVRLKCRDCGCTDVVRRYGERTFRCRRCWNYHSALIDTPFERIKRLREGLLLLWLKERNVDFNTQDFHGFTKLAYQTVEKLEIKLASAIADAKKDAATSVCSHCNGTGKCSTCTGSGTTSGAVSKEGEVPPTKPAGAKENKHTEEIPDLEPPGAFLGPIDEYEKRLLAELTDEPRHIDILAHVTKMDTMVAMATLFRLEMRKMVATRGEYYYRI